MPLTPFQEPKLISVKRALHEEDRDLLSIFLGVEIAEISGLIDERNNSCDKRKYIESVG